MPASYRSATSCPSCSTTSASVYVSANTSAAVAAVPSSRQTGGSGIGPGQAGSGEGPPGFLGPAGISWLGMSSRMCRNAHRLNGGSCQLARVTCDSGAGGKPVMSSGALSREAASAVPSWIMMRTLTQHQHRER